MGYTTAFVGAFTSVPALTEAQRAYLIAFAETRRMQRDEAKAAKLEDPLREAVGLPVGRDGGYFVNGQGFCGQDDDPSVLDSNGPPEGQPGLWCQWVPNEDGTAIVWDNGEKFYHYVEWIQYIVTHFMEPWNVTLNGEVTWCGEDPYDHGKIVITNNCITAMSGEVTYR